MKITVTGSLGNISQPLTKTLVQQGHTVTVISSAPEKQKEIEALGATAAIGTLEDVSFLVSAFSGADAVYCMVPPNAYFAGVDPVIYYSQLGNNYAQAIQQTGIRRVVHLSSYGAHLDKGTGPILGAHYSEGILNKLPGVAVTHIRATYFYYNLYSFTGMIKAAGFIGSNYDGDDRLLMVSPIDIAAAIAEELVKPGAGKNVRYVSGDERTGHEIAQVLGKAVGKPDLKWITLTPEQMRQGMEARGLPPGVITGFIELGIAIHSGVLREDYDLNKPVMSKIKLEDFAREFAAGFNQNDHH